MSDSEATFLKHTFELPWNEYEIVYSSQITAFSRKWSIHSVLVRHHFSFLGGFAVTVILLPLSFLPHSFWSAQYAFSLAFIFLLVYHSVIRQGPYVSNGRYVILDKTYKWRWKEICILLFDFLFIWFIFTSFTSDSSNLLTKGKRLWIFEIYTNPQDYWTKWIRKRW